MSTPDAAFAATIATWALCERRRSRKKRLVQRFGVVADLNLVARVEDLTALWAHHEVFDVALGSGPIAHLFDRGRAAGLHGREPCALRGSHAIGFRTVELSLLRGAGRVPF